MGGTGAGCGAGLTRAGHRRALICVVAVVVSLLVTVGATRPADAQPVGTTVIVAAGIKSPAGITAGPDGDLWFTDTGDNSIGRMTPAGVLAFFTGTGISGPYGIAVGPGRRPVVHQLGQQLDRADHPGGRGVELHGHRHQLPRTGSRRARTASCGSPTRATTRSGGSRRRGWCRTSPATEHQRPVRDRVGPGREPVVHQRRQRLDRADHAAGGGVELRRYRHQRPAAGSPSGPDGNLWFTNADNDVDRADHAGGRGDQLHRHRHRARRAGSPSGPDGNLWFTNAATTRSGGSPRPGRCRTSPVPASAARTGSRPGPDGNLWFTNPASTSIGRITPAGVVSTFAGAGISGPVRDRGGPGREPLVHQPGQQLDRADHAGGRGVELHRAPASAHRRGSRRVRTATCGSPTTATTRSGGSPRPAWCRTSPAPASATPQGIAAGPDGNLWFANHGSNSIGRITPAGVVSNFTGAGISAPSGIAAGPDGNLWFTNTATTRSGGSRRPVWSPTSPAPASATRRAIAAGPDGNLWFTNNRINELDRADHAGGGGDRPSPVPASAAPCGIAAGPDGNLWFTNCGNSSIGRITPAGVVSNFTGTGLIQPERDHRRARTGRCGSPTTATTRSAPSSSTAPYAHPYDFAGDRHGSDRGVPATGPGR